MLRRTAWWWLSVTAVLALAIEGVPVAQQPAAGQAAGQATGQAGQAGRQDRVADAAAAVGVAAAPLGRRPSATTCRPRARR